MRLDELVALAVWGAAEQHVDAVERRVGYEFHIELAHESLVYRANVVSGIAATANPLQFYIGVVYEQPYQLAGCVTSTTYNTSLNHSCLPFLTCMLW